MRLDNRCHLRTVAGEHIILQPSATTGGDLRVVAFNETACLLWKTLCNSDFTPDDAVQVLLSHYDVDRATATRDVAIWLQTLRENQMLVSE
ncbi:MAG: hypothetical protein AUK63_883 [bacterium P3]|nr:MAG: hypothetical protein AUK63_883 [bacterium P3]KWW41509.1 MAG: hypothetical protein F083_1071 [bacterium F083]